MIEIGEILIQVRYKQYKRATDAVEAMQKNGCKISYDQYKALERGKMPNKQQMIEICKFFNIKPDCWFMGECKDKDEYYNLLDGLSPRMKRLAQENLESIKRADKEEQPKRLQ